MILITCIIIYITSFIFAREFCILAKSEGGEWYGLDLDLSDVICVVFPIVNIFFAINYIFIDYKDDWDKNKSKISKKIVNLIFNNKRKVL